MKKFTTILNWTIVLTIMAIIAPIEIIVKLCAFIAFTICYLVFALMAPIAKFIPIGDWTESLKNYCWSIHLAATIKVGRCYHRALFENAR